MLVLDGLCIQKTTTDNLGTISYHPSYLSFLETLGMVAVVRVACALRTGDLAKTHAFWIDEYNIIYIYIFFIYPI